MIWMAFLLLQSGKIVNIYLDLIIGALVESVSYVILYFLVRTVYRKPLIFTLSGALAFLIMVALIFRAFGTGLSGTRFKMLENMCVSDSDQIPSDQGR